MSDATTQLNSSHEGGGHSAHMMFNEGIIIIFVMLIIYMAFEAFKHKKDLSFGHEASLVCVLGVLISAIYTYKGASEFTDIMEFNDDLFFYFVLPPIIFASGYNMYRKKFFDNITNIVLFGVLGTFVIFGLFAGASILIIQNIPMTQMKYLPATDEW